MSDPASNYVGQLSADGRWRWDGAAWTPVTTTSGPALPVWLNLRVRSRPTWAMVISVVAVGLLTDQALQAGTFGLGAAATIVAIAVLLAFVGGPGRFESRLSLAIAAVFGCSLAVRASAWLVWPDLVAGVALIGLAASYAARGSLFDAGAAELSARALNAAGHMAAGAAFVGKPIVHFRRNLVGLGPIVRGVLIAIPICVLLSVLLASADPVFASFFAFNLDFGRLVTDIVFVTIGGLAMAGLIRVSAAEPLDRIDGPIWRLGATEALVVLALLDAVFAAFAFAQVLAATGSAADTLRSAGVTYSEYARSGFFQLLWAGGITLVLLILFSRITGLTKPEHKLAFLILSETAIALTLMIVVVAFRRLSLYEQAYGFTMLRLYSHIFAAWIALVFLFLATELLGLWRHRRWFVGAALFSAVVVLIALNLVNPEAVVVALNVNHAQATGKVDTDYLAQLSSDATPALLDAVPVVGPTLGRDIVSVACRGPRTYAPAISAFNISDAGAAAARRTSCR
jgi:uncharacterized protein DUF4153